MIYFECEEKETEERNQRDWSWKYEDDNENRHCKSIVVSQIKVVVIKHFPLVFVSSDSEFLEPHVQVVWNVENLHDVGDECDLNQVSEEELRRLQKVLTQLNGERAPVLMNEELQEGLDVFLLGDRDENGVHHNEQELLEEIRSVSDRLVLVLFIVRDPVYQRRNEHVVVSEDYKRVHQVHYQLLERVAFRHFTPYHRVHDRKYLPIIEQILEIPWWG